MFLAENFDMSYVDENGEKKRPYIIHRSSIGCYERTMALMIEKFAGAFPVWVSPVQVKVISLTDRTVEECKKISEKLKTMGIRSEVDSRSETVGYKIRAAQLEKVPYMLIIGDKEVENNVVAVRRRGGVVMGEMSLMEFAEKVLDDVATKRLD